MPRVGLVALLVFLVIPPAASGGARHGGVAIVSRDLPAAGRTLAVPGRFDMVGLRWRGPGTVTFRTRSGEGRWSAWQVPDDANPSWTGTSSTLQYRTHGSVSRLRVSYIWSPVERETWRTLSVAGSPPIVSRDDWGGNELLRRNQPRYAPAVRLVIVHHTATPNDYTPDQAAAIVRGIDIYHVRTNGWNDIGYNFLVDKCGNIYEGRAGGVAKPVLGAHTLGFNTDSMGIAVLGSFGSAKPSKAALDAVARLTAWKLGLWGADPRGTTYLTSGGGNLHRKGKNVRLNVISGHRDGFATQCPGRRLYRELGTIRSSAARYQGRQTGPRGFESPARRSAYTGRPMQTFRPVPAGSRDDR